MTLGQPATARPSRLAAIGDGLRRHRRWVQRIQWTVVVVYAVLLIVPACLPLPDHQAQILSHLTVFAAFVFWGLWWPFVLVSMVLLGRVWCGVFCPEGTLTEAASRVGLGRPIPAWIRWPGWPFVAFLGTTLYGQMASVYQYPLGALVVLGGSTLAATLVGLVYGKGKRVWCRYLCPVRGVFGLLAKLAPVHFHTDQAAWVRFNRETRHQRPRSPAPDCGPLIPLKQLDSTSDCHMCGRCSDYKSSIRLRLRAPASEVIRPPRDGQPTGWEFVLLLYGVLGVAVGSFQWTVSPWFVALKQTIATWLVSWDWLWPLTTTLPAWVLTNYPAQNDVFNLLDGVTLLLYITATGALLGSVLAMLLALANRLLGRWSWSRLWHLGYCLIPLAGLGVFLGLTGITVTLLGNDGIRLGWVNEARATLLALGALASAVLAWKIAGGYATGGRRMVAMVGPLLAILSILAAWWLMFWGWS
ncbi:4Fe-4S binding protein [Marinobacter xestospongiae]|uniref:4Fe-4S binding protein n=1 Tax=Marinobacter xestospongiae TaxID=994319 RepID=UPI00200328F0|nr:4Fe-4S binding protein [Marinobacter xestospongiae]MCK7567440.1 4Fe-4S binding protein [Marinobacter xestospongiae]